MSSALTVCLIISALAVLLVAAAALLPTDPPTEQKWLITTYLGPQPQEWIVSWKRVYSLDDMIEFEVDGKKMYVPVVFTTIEEL